MGRFPDNLQICKELRVHASSQDMLALGKIMPSTKVKDGRQAIADPLSSPTHHAQTTDEPLYTCLAPPFK